MLSKIRQKVFISLICFLPFSAFLFKKVDPWWMQGYFLQYGILVLYCLHLFSKNKPFAVLLFWCGSLTTCLWVMISADTKNYPINIFLPFFNLICMVIFYDLITQYFKKEDLARVFRYFSYSLIVILIYCILQKLNLDQFHNSTNSGNIPYPDELVGTLGNTMHLAHYLAICLPLLFWNKPLTLVALGIIGLTGSSSGMIIALCVLVFASIFKRTFTVRETILLGILGILFLFYKFGSLGKFVFSSGRLEIWKSFYHIFQQKSITGWGLGIMNAFAQKPEFHGWRHTHLEVYHYAIEIGLIGVGIIIWGIIDYFKRFIKAEKTYFVIITSSMFVGFLISSLFGFPSHLWLLSTMGLLSYTYIFLEA